jgi:hypothetical protein
MAAQRRVQMNIHVMIALAVAAISIGIGFLNYRYQTEEAEKRAALVCAYVMVLERGDAKAAKFTPDGLLLLKDLHKSCERYNVYDPQGEYQH